MALEDTPSNVTAPRRIQKRKRETPASRVSRTPNAYARRSPPPPAPAPIEDEEDTTPRQLKRPGAGARIAREQREAADAVRRKLEEQRKLDAASRPTNGTNIVAEHYNNVRQYGRDFRNTESKIKGLRSLNNWIKSTLIQKFSLPDGVSRNVPGPGPAVLDLACGKGGDLGKWEKAPKVPALYVGCDIAEVSIEQAKDRYRESMSRGGRNKRHMPAEFYWQDAFSPTITEIDTIRRVGFNPNAAPGNAIIQPGMPSGGFDVVSMMFALHYSFESEEKARGLLKNIAGALKKGGRFIGVTPNSDVISANVTRLSASDTEAPDKKVPTPPAEDSEDEWNPEEASEPANIASVSVESPSTAGPTAPSTNPPISPLSWGNSIYTVRFPTTPPPPTDGIFRPPFGWKYHYSLEEAVDTPEYVVPWEAFRALADEYGLELMYRKPFGDVFEDEKDDRELGQLAERMGVMSRDRSEGRGGLMVSEEEMEAAGFYHAFCFYRT